MRLWTMQPVEVYNILRQDGVFTCDPTKVPEPSFIDRYGWLVKKLSEKDSKPCNVDYPVWAWYRFNGKEKKPDLRHSCYGSRGEKMVCLELEVPDEKVLLSDFDLWHFPLNNWWLPDCFYEGYGDAEDELINKTLVKIEDILNAHKVRDYNDKVKRGLRFIRLKNIDGAIFVLLVTGEDGISEDVTKEIANIEEVKSIHFTINTTRYQDFDMQGFKKIYGVSTLPYECLGKKYVFSAKSEFPTYPKMEEKKIEILKSMIKEDANVLSINCGVGLLENAIVNDVVGIDSKKEHIKDASDNAHFLRKENVKFVCKNIDEAVVSLCKKNHYDVAVLRSEGLSEAIKQSMILSRVNEIIYVTSHASSLAKDYEDLKKYYHLESITPLDMYPNQAKLEMIAHFVKN